LRGRPSGILSPEVHDGAEGSGGLDDDLPRLLEFLIVIRSPPATTHLFVAIGFVDQRHHLCSVGLSGGCHILATQPGVWRESILLEERPDFFTIGPLGLVRREARQKPIQILDIPQ
jgi:hypothetical protein